MDASALEFSESVQLWVNQGLAWIGFGTLTGLLAKAIMPGRDPGGAVATLLMGIGGTVIGCGIVAYFQDNLRIAPISPLGLIIATLGAFVILFFYRLLGGYLFIEGERPRRAYPGRHYRRGGARRRIDSVLLDD